MSFDREGGGRGGYGGGRPKEFHKAVCSDCKKNAKFHSNRAVTVRSTARIAFPNARKATANPSGITGFTLVVNCEP